MLSAWLFASLALIVADLFLTTTWLMWFGFGSLAAAVALLLGADVLLQLFVFAVVSFLLLVYTRPLLTRFLERSASPTLGLTPVPPGANGRVVRTIRPDEPGRVCIGDVTWEAVADGVIMAGSIVEVLEVSAMRLVVRPVGGSGGGGGAGGGVGDARS